MDRQKTQPQFIEQEIKFILSKDEISKLKERISKLHDKIRFVSRKYEQTIMFDNAEKIMDREDARLRVRVIKSGITDNDGDIKVEFSYKRRIQNSSGDNIKREEEIETFFEMDNNAYNNFILILNKMGFYQTSSYERFREAYTADNEQIKLTIDEFPFGYIVEIEGRDKESINNCRSLLGLDTYKPTLEGCDDIYERICRERGIAPKSNICFDDDEMPKL